MLLVIRWMEPQGVRFYSCSVARVFGIRFSGLDRADIEPRYSLKIKELKIISKNLQHFRKVLYFSMYVHVYIEFNAFQICY